MAIFSHSGESLFIHLPVDVLMSSTNKRKKLKNDSLIQFKCLIYQVLSTPSVGNNEANVKSECGLNMRALTSYFVKSHVMLVNVKDFYISEAASHHISNSV